MAQGDVTLTRGVGYRDDQASVTGWGQANFLLAGTETLTADGDIYTDTIVFNNDSNGDYGIESSPVIVSQPSTTTYPKLLFRHKENWTSGDTSASLIPVYTDLTSDVFPLTLSTSYRVDAFNLTTGKFLDHYGVQIKSMTNGNSNTRVVNWDFFYVFKETLTLPAVSQPMPLSVQRYVVELPIPTREGGIVQDLGSQSAVVEVDGTLITTTTPNNYTGEQWWDVLVGTELEANWQWLSSDRINYKYQIETLTPTQEPGKVGFYGFKMKLRKVDVLGATAQTFGAIQ